MSAEQNRLQQDAHAEHFSYPERKRVHISVHPLVSLIITVVVCAVFLTIWVVYGVTHQQDFIANTLSLMDGGFWLLRVGAILFVIWVGVVIVGSFVERVVHPIIHVVGQIKRHRVLAQNDHYAVLGSKDGPQFHQVSQMRVREEAAQIAEPAPQLQLPGPHTFSSVLQQGFVPSSNQIFLGYLEGGQAITSTMAELCHIANAGATGGGKSSNVRLVVSQLCYAGADVVLLNPHYTQYDIRAKEDWTPIENRLLRKPYIQFEDIRRYLEWAAIVELRRRLSLYNASQEWGTPLFIVMDELPAIAKAIPGAMNWMADILREGRKVDLYLITAAQDFLVKTIGGSGAIRDCFRTAIYVGGDATTARVLLDVKGTVDDGGLGKGLVMIRSSQVKKAAFARMPYADNESLYSLLGPSTYVPGKVVESNPVDNDDFFDDEPADNVRPFPVAIQQPTYEDAVEAWNSGATSRRKLMEALDCHENLARKYHERILSEAQAK